MIGFGAFLAVIGAILKYAVEGDIEGFSFETAGAIFMIVGLGLVLLGIILYAMDYFDERAYHHSDPVIHEDRVDYAEHDADFPVAREPRRLRTRRRFRRHH